MNLRLMFDKSKEKKKKKKKKIGINPKGLLKRVYERNKKYKKLMETLDVKKKPDTKIRY